MVSIVKFVFPSLWNSEYPLVINRIIDIVGAHNPHSIHLGLSFERLEAFRTKMSKIEVQERSDRDSAKLSELDHQRDALFKAVCTAAKVFNRTPMPEVNRHAARVMTVLKKHGSNIPAANYTAETKRLYDLTADFYAQPDVMASLEALSLKPLLERMNEINRDFDRLFMQRNQRQSETEKVDIRAIRIECDKTVTMLWNAIEFCCSEYGEEDYIHLINTINNLNSYYKHHLAARTTRRRAKQNVENEEPIKPLEN